MICILLILYVIVNSFMTVFGKQNKQYRRKNHGFGNKQRKNT